MHHGMKHVVCSPGSRNAPFMIAFDEHPEIKTYVIHDERSAAFFALGLAQQLQTPVGIVCTSGSAPLNYFPAIAEAYYQCVPLVVITADRPEEWVDQGDGQTIVQRDVFGKHVRYACSFSDNEQNSDASWYVQRETAIAFNMGNGEWKGPIHFNVGLREPLYTRSEAQGIVGTSIYSSHGEFRLGKKDLKVCEEGLSLPKKLVLCGQMNPDPKLLETLVRFADDHAVLVLVENTSNLKNQRFVHCIDRLLNVISEDEWADFTPDLLITLGGAIVSKRIKSFLRKNKPKMHWKIGNEFPFMDTFQCLTHTFQTDAASFFAELLTLSYPKHAMNYGVKWKQQDFQQIDRLPAVIGNLPYADLGVFDVMHDYLPENSVLHMANSSVVRYCQLFDPINSVDYYCNRGTSGIDGSTSTAVGAAAADEDRLHVIVTGDISFFYDSNALWNRYIGQNFRIILVNNQGGGIFNIIPGPASTPQREAYFEAHHEHQAADLCKTFHIGYTSVDSLQSFADAMADFYSVKPGEGAKLIEIHTPGLENAKILDDFFVNMRSHN
ncbi:MAG: 2-succinyl-5-enolpyruvyl-6-hydroxy-3-cyclohexene-carboxylic-acid synthase [Bacteroidota bacterium]